MFFCLLRPPSKHLGSRAGTGAVGGSYDVRSAAGAESRSELRGIKDRLAAQAAKSASSA